jgi:uncharacterized protein (TIRG00374 family)
MTKLKLLIKVTFVVALLWILAQKGFLSLSETRLAFARLDLILPAIGLLLVTTLLGVSRWKLLLHAQGIELNWLRTLQLTMVGNFFNIALPGAVSGDFVKAWYIGREIPGKRARAFGSILFDRVSGLSALVLVSATAFVFGVETYPTLRIFMFIAGVAVIGFYAYLFLVRENADPVLRALKNAEARYPKAGSFVRVYEGLRHYHNHRGTVLKVLALSIAVHLMVGLACRNFAYALGDHQLPLLAIYVVVPMGLLVTAIPILPAGVGTGHAAFLFLFKLLDSDQGANIFTLYALIMITLGCIGGLFYLQFRTHEPKPDLEAIG